jgi:hypothetical protein
VVTQIKVLIVSDFPMFIHQQFTIVARSYRITRNPFIWKRVIKVFYSCRTHSAEFARKIIKQCARDGRTQAILTRIENSLKPYRSLDFSATKKAKNDVLAFRFLLTELRFSAVTL